ncbi:hypothetical protein [Pajaroellobacter abortibovis]|uniref:Uncharacterized protein n=1 Tax=Pajaroellobacter abortibovis TaxID=1882918 RepID=A0A1L6MY01_9BACT|nr:hypothetical protein [Pajaroellobacter abortibovis]APS00275.1 hypothetical protein BCY86_05945 [Pajaroellobacter abortibovis]
MKRRSERKDDFSSVCLSRPSRWMMIAALMGGMVMVVAPQWKQFASFFFSKSNQEEEFSASLNTLPPSDKAGSASTISSPGKRAIENSLASVVPFTVEVISCHDRGLRKTIPKNCDRLIRVEQILNSALTNVGCTLPLQEQGFLQVDIRFLRLKQPVQVAISSSLDKMTYPPTQLARCRAMIEKALSSELAKIPHQHEHYKLAIRSLPTRVSHSLLSDVGRPKHSFSAL